MKYWAIQQISTGFFLPQRNRRGQTHEKPTDAKPPRLFNKKHHAAYALKCWLLGDWKESQNYSMGEWESTGPEPPRLPPTDRNKEDMRVVEVKVIAGIPAATLDI